MSGLVLVETRLERSTAVGGLGACRADAGGMAILDHREIHFRPIGKSF